LSEKSLGTVTIFGLGYVGLNLSKLLTESNFKVIGVDTDEIKIAKMENCIESLGFVDFPELGFQISHNFVPLSSLPSDHLTNVYVICVPTPLTEKVPDLSGVISASTVISKRLRKGQLVLLESTVAPGTTENIVLNILSQYSALEVGKDFNLAFSPERVNPGDLKTSISTVPKIVGGVTIDCTNAAQEFYSYIFEKIEVATSSKVAEMTKLLENTFRLINISFVNELQVFCSRAEIDIWECIDLASSKPYGFLPFYPGAGAGGHCIPIDPVYLTHYSSTNYGFDLSLVERALQINALTKEKIVGESLDLLGSGDLGYVGKKVLVIGVAYKRNVSDTRESPALEIISGLKGHGIDVAYFDPLVPQLEVGEELLMTEEDLLTGIEIADLIVLLQAHDGMDLSPLLQSSVKYLDPGNNLRSI